MFSKTYFDEKAVQFNRTHKKFKVCLDKKNFVQARRRLEDLYDLLESMKAIARCNAYDELDFESYDYALEEIGFCESLFKYDFKDFTSALVNELNN